MSGTRTSLDPYSLMQDQRPPLQRTLPLPGFAPPVGQRFYLTFTYTLARHVWYPWDRFQYRCLVSLDAPVEALQEPANSAAAAPSFSVYRFVQ
jgi:hypothetical protein